MSNKHQSCQTQGFYFSVFGQLPSTSQLSVLLPNTFFFFLNRCSYSVTGQCNTFRGQHYPPTCSYTSSHTESTGSFALSTPGNSQRLNNRVDTILLCHSGGRCHTQVLIAKSICCSSGFKLYNTHVISVKLRICKDLQILQLNRAFSSQGLVFKQYLF